MNLKAEASGAFTASTDWRHLKFFENVNFGVKEISNVVPMPSDMFGCVDLCIFSALGNFDSSMEGGVGIFVSLPAPALLTFKEEMDALTLLI